MGEASPACPAASASVAIAFGVQSPSPACTLAALCSATLAAASCAVAQDLGIPNERFNLHGGAVSLGHPLGASGARCLITMVGAMRRIDAKSGIVTLCLGGGNAVAMLVRRP